MKIKPDNTYYRLFECGDEEAKKCREEMKEKKARLDGLVAEILDACWIDKEENPATAMLIHKLLQGEK